MEETMPAQVPPRSSTAGSPTGQMLTKRAYVDLLRTASAACR
ncbi:putative leader peptide [Kineosporia babensis]